MRLVGKPVDDVALLKSAAYICEQCALASVVIDNSQLSKEAKSGITVNINGLARAFSLAHINSATSASVKDVNGAITNLVILLSALGLEADRPNPPEANDLVADIADMMAAFENFEIDPAVRDVAKRHLQTLSTLLQNVPIFGLEAALSAYFEMVTRLRRADIDTSEKSHAKVVDLFDKIKSWGDKLSTLDKTWNAGAKLLGHADKAQGLLEYLPHVL